MGYYIPTLSVALIVKNEEESIVKCLQSVHRADEIIIVDTGSTDNTIAVIREHFPWDKVHIYSGNDYKWRDDFSHHRNQALNLCTSDWVLSIDADEELQTPIGTVKEYCAIYQDYVDVYGLNVNMVTGGPGSQFRYPRLFKNNFDEIRWKGVIHEHPTISSLNRANIDITIKYGYSPAHANDPDRSKRILKKAVSEEPENSRYQYYYAREFFYSKEYDVAYGQFLKYLSIATWFPEIVDAKLYMARCLFNMNKGDEARELCLEVIKLNPDFKEALLFMSELHYEPHHTYWANFSKVAKNNGVLFVRT